MSMRSSFSQKVKYYNQIGFFFSSLVLWTKVGVAFETQLILENFIVHILHELKFETSYR